MKDSDRLTVELKHLYHHHYLRTQTTPRDFVINELAAYAPQVSEALLVAQLSIQMSEWFLCRASISQPLLLLITI